MLLLPMTRAIILSSYPPLAPAASRGARLDTRGRDTCLPLHVAAVRGHADTVAYLVARGQPVDSLDGAGRTPLMLGEEQPQIINSSRENDSHSTKSCASDIKTTETLIGAAKPPLDRIGLDKLSNENVSSR